MEGMRTCSSAAKDAEGLRLLLMLLKREGAGMVEVKILKRSKGCWSIFRSMDLSIKIMSTL